MEQQTQRSPQAPDRGEPPTSTPAATRLQQARTEVIAEIGRTDSKAAALLAAFGLPLAVLVAVVPGKEITTAATVLIGLGAAGLVAAMLVVLLAVRPRIGGTTRGSYLHWATCTPEQLRADVAADNNAEQIVKLSRIAAAKYRRLRLAIDITAGALVLLALALAAALALS
ncbi:Pycsar system effector family protein [Streptomyces sp. NPDC088745]|uniref:Pycsar system effector family protein n=1 Tax=Streptomyces sp. NPDC088745 TaxID=3365884 RepID=UPI00380FF332